MKVSLRHAFLLWHQNITELKTTQLQKQLQESQESNVQLEQRYSNYLLNITFYIYIYIYIYLNN